MVLAELRAVALIEDEDDALVTERGEQLLPGRLVVLLPLLVPLAALIQREAELLDGGDDHLVGVGLREQPADEGGSVGVLLDAAFLEAVELLPRLPVEVLPVDHEDALVDMFVLLEQGRGLEGGERLAAAGGVPDEPVAVILIDALDEVLHGIDLIGPHDHQLLLPGQQHHVAADGAGEVALLEEALSEWVEVGDLRVRLVRELVDGQKALIGIEGEVAGVIVGEVEGAVAIADDEELHEAEQRLGVAIAGIVLVLDDLLHGAARIDAKRLQLDLDAGDAIDQQDDIVAVVAVVRVDAKLVDDLEVVFAPVPDVDQRVVQRRPIVAGEGVDIAQGLRGGEDIRRNDLIQQAGKLGIRQADAVELLELVAEILLQCGSVRNLWAVDILQV